MYSAVCALCIVYCAVHSKLYNVLCTHGNKLFSQALIFLSSNLCNLIFQTLTIWSKLEILKVFNIRLQRSIGRENKSMGRVISSFVYNVSCTYTRVDIFKTYLDEDKWKLYRRTDGGGIQEYTVPFQNLVPETSYSFRVIAYNEFGISPPATTQEEVGYSFIHSFIHSFILRFTYSSINPSFDSPATTE